MVPHIPRGLVAARVCLPPEMDHFACPGFPGWKAYSNQMSTRGGSFYHNYTGFHSIVLLALVDGDYKFLWVEVGAAGSSSDAQIFKHSDLRHIKRMAASASLRVNTWGLVDKR